MTTSPTPRPQDSAEVSWLKHISQDASTARRLWWKAAREQWHAPGVAVARLGLDVTTWVITLTTLLVWCAPFLMDLVTPFGAMDLTPEVLKARLNHPVWWGVGSLLMACAVSLHLLCGSWGDALVWSNDESDMSISVEVVARTLMWRTLRVLVRIGMALLSGMTYIALLRWSAQTQGIGIIACSGMLYALGLTALLWLSLALEYAGARYVTSEESLGEALIEALGLCANHLYGSYKLVIMSATLSAPAFALYVLCSMWAASSSTSGGSAIMGTQVLLFVSISVSTTVFRAASAKWIHAHTGAKKADIATAPPSPQEHLDSLAAFLPSSFEHVVSWSKVLNHRQDDA